jgi:hypothetical protein
MGKRMNIDIEKQNDIEKFATKTKIMQTFKATPDTVERKEIGKSYGSLELDLRSDLSQSKDEEAKQVES